MLANAWVDQFVWTALWSMYAPYRMPTLMSDADQWVQQVSLNGARWANLCKPYDA